MENLEKPSLLVVGGGGFIGSHVVREAVRLKWKVDSVGLGDPMPYRRVIGASYMRADLTKPETLGEIGKFKYHFVINLGGYVDHSLYSSRGRSVIASHFEGLMNLLDRLDSSRIKRFVQIGSSDEYGSLLAPQPEGQREEPTSPYSFGKVASTHFLQMLHRTEGFPAVMLRLFLVYGPGQDEKRFLPQIIRGCLKEEIFPTSGGEQVRDFCFIDDVVRAVFAVLDAEAAVGEVFNVGSAQPVQIKEVIQRVCQMTNKGRPQYGVIDYRSGENMALYPDCRKIRTVIGWKPKVNLDTGIQRTIDWMRYTL